MNVLKSRLLIALKTTIFIAIILAIVAVVLSFFIGFKLLDNYILTICLAALFMLSKRYKVKHCDKLAIAGLIFSVINLI